MANAQEELHRQHAVAEDIIGEWASEDLSPEDRAVLEELNQEERKSRENDGTVAFRAQLLAHAAVKAAQTEHNAGDDNSWSRSSNGSA